MTRLSLFAADKHNSLSDRMINKYCEFGNNGSYYNMQRKWLNEGHNSSDIKLDKNLVSNWLIVLVLVDCFYLLGDTLYHNI